MEVPVKRQKEYIRDLSDLEISVAKRMIDLILEESKLLETVKSQKDVFIDFSPPPNQDEDFRVYISYHVALRDKTIKLIWNSDVRVHIIKVSYLG